ncbi:MAG: sulfite exporter TauE/SafE family protein [Sandaracinaceae bacterium]|nr:sulfite exporter TauE/SafE family protein [Sandaracinaceae bacterium]
MEPERIALLGLLALAGVAAGFINVVAGGGSLLTLPALMLLGLPAGLANGTNRLAIVTQSVAGVIAYRRAGRLPSEAMAPVLVPTVLGAGCGAAVAAYVPDAILEPVLLGTLVLMALVMLVRPSLLTPAEGDGPVSWRERPWALAGLFGAGLYGGFIQAGVGFVLLAVLGGVLRYDLARANALKLVCTALYGVVVLAIFVAAGQVEWVAASVLAVATVVGSQLGVRFAVKASPKVLNAIVFVAVVASAIAIALRGR